MNDNPVYYHTQKCLDLQATREKIHLEWITAWPSYCHHCHATGEISTPGSSVPYGSINVNLPDDVDPCPECSEKGKCPRCGKVIANAEDPDEYDAFFNLPKACPECGFSWGKDKEDNEPWLIDECSCWYEKEKEQGRDTW